MDVAFAAEALAEALAQQGASGLQKARSLMQQALDVLTAKVGGAHPLVAASLRRRAGLELAGNGAAQGLDAAEQALRISQQASERVFHVKPRFINVGLSTGWSDNL